MLRGFDRGNTLRAHHSVGAQEDVRQSARRQDAERRKCDQTGGRGCAVRTAPDDEPDEPLPLDPELEPVLPELLPPPGSAVRDDPEDEPVLPCE